VSALAWPAVALQDAFGGAQISFLVMSAMAGGDRVERRLAAIFAADIAGYSRLMNIDELGTVQTLTAYRETMDGLIKQRGGRVANTAGDSVLAEFPSVVDAVECAVAI
jgi:adenylate cyclase